MHSSNLKPNPAPPPVQLSHLYYFSADQFAPLRTYLQVLYWKYAHLRAFPDLFHAAVGYQLLIHMINWQFDHDVTMHGPEPTHLLEGMEWAFNKVPLEA